MEVTRTITDENGKYPLPYQATIKLIGRFETREEAEAWVSSILQAAGYCAPAGGVEEPPDSEKVPTPHEEPVYEHPEETIGAAVRSDAWGGEEDLYIKEHLNEQHAVMAAGFYEAFPESVRTAGAVSSRYYHHRREAKGAGQVVEDHYDWQGAQVAHALKDLWRKRFPIGARCKIINLGNGEEGTVVAHTDHSVILDTGESKRLECNPKYIRLVEAER